MPVRLTLLWLLCLLLPFATWGEERTQEDSVTSSPVATEMHDAIGIGTEGYGSPVRSDVLRGGEIFSSRSGYFHPFLALGGYYTDNLFNAADDEKSDFITVLTPGIWVAVPGARRKLAEVSTLNTAPGGLALSRFRPDTERRFQGYALYRADIREHDDYSDENRTDHRAEGLIQVNLRGGLSFGLLDVYEQQADPYGTGGTPERVLDEFSSNLVSAILTYELSPKLTLRGDYSRYDLDYDSIRNRYRDRQDDAVSAYIFYHLSPKTAVFIQPEYITVDYDRDPLSDSEATNVYVGLEMDVTNKIRGRVKLGYGSKDFDRAGYDDRDDWLAEGQVDYFFTPKTSIYLRGLRQVNETDILGGEDFMSHRLLLGYRQRMTAKLRAEAAVQYRDDDYRAGPDGDDALDDRDDQYYVFSAAFGFTPLRWLNFSAGYEYRERNSNVTGEDYTTNSVFARATAAF